MHKPTTRERARELVLALLTAAERAEATSRRNGRDTTAQSSVYPGGELIDGLLDIRSTLDGSDHLGVIVDEALAEYGRRPGACTTAEVRELCSSSLGALTPNEVPS